MSLCYDQNLSDLVTYNAFMYFQFHRVNNILVRESERKFGALPTKLRQIAWQTKGTYLRTNHLEEEKMR